MSATGQEKESGASRGSSLLNGGIFIERNGVTYGPFQSKEEAKAHGFYLPDKEETATIRRSKTFELVIKDFRARDQQGFRLYNRAIENADIDGLKEAYEEALDLAVYLRQALYDRDGK